MSQQGLDTAIADTTVDEDTIVPAERLQGFLLLLRVYTALARSSLGGHGYVSRFVSALRLSLYAVVLRSSTDNSRDKPNEFRAARTSFVPGLGKCACSSPYLIRPRYRLASNPLLGLDYTPRLVVSCRVRPSRLCRPSPAPSVLVVETRNKEPNRDVRHLGFAAMRPELATDLKRAEGGLQLSTGNISDSSQRYPHSGESSWLLLFWVFLAGRWWRRTSFSGNG
ncbi:hypothetical protein C8F01DRAFT_1181978 [Mycena amicta]|nr:hypothetical protein C8F01DRAFT_1181978 [Mycena amicta]